jgi:hypothetical protein
MTNALEAGRTEREGRRENDGPNRQKGRIALDYKMST